MLARARHRCDPARKAAAGQGGRGRAGASTCGAYLRPRRGGASGSTGRRSPRSTSWSPRSGGCAAPARRVRAGRCSSCPHLGGLRRRRHRRSRGRDLGGGAVSERPSRRPLYAYNHSNAYVRAVKRFAARMKQATSGPSAPTTRGRSTCAPPTAPAHHRTRTARPRTSWTDLTPAGRHQSDLHRVRGQRVRVRELGLADPAGPDRLEPDPRRSSGWCCSRSPSAR